MVRHNLYVYTNNLRVVVYLYGINDGIISIALNILCLIIITQCLGMIKRLNKSVAIRTRFCHVTMFGK